MTPWSAQFVEAVGIGLANAADPERSPKMAAYMKDHFEFFGVPAPIRKAIAAGALAALDRPTESDLRALAHHSWAQPQREWQYVAVDALIRFIKQCCHDTLDTAEQMITAKSWWDTVDAIAVNIVGPLVRGDHDGRLRMDEWLDSGELWLARSAILHQLKYRQATDAEWLFAACLQHAPHKDFFIRKAIGWALREYAKTDPVEVANFVAQHRGRLSPLSIREATKHL